MASIWVKILLYQIRSRGVVPLLHPLMEYLVSGITRVFPRCKSYIVYLDKKRRPHRFSPVRRPHKFLQRNHCRHRTRFNNACQDELYLFPLPPPNAGWLSLGRRAAEQQPAQGFFVEGKQGPQVTEASESGCGGSGDKNCQKTT